MKKSSEYKIRRLVRGDRVTISRIIEKAANSPEGQHLLSLISSAGGEKPEDKEAAERARSQLGIEIIRLLLRILNDEVSEWFASLLNITIDEFNNEAPFDIEVEIVKQLMAADEVTGFFSGALAQFKKTSLSAETPKGKKMKSGTKTA